MNTFIAGVFLGIIGSGYILYGRKARNWVALGSGVALCILPYVVDGFLWTMVIGGVLLALPFVITL